MRLVGSSLVVSALVLLGCKGASGPPLPPDVGTNHTTAGRETTRPAASEPPAVPVGVGTLVWANYHDTGFYFHGVVIERRDAMHRVLYADGANEWLPAEALLPDSLGDDAQVHVRSAYGGEFQSATVGRRLGQAVYVRLANGDERWTALPHIRFQVGAENIPVRGDEPVVMNAPAGEVGSDVLVNYQLEGLKFAGVVTARAEDGRAHVVYLDGETQWVHPSLLSADDVGEGTVVHVRRTWEPADWVRGRVERRIGHALRVQLDDGGVAWTSMFRVRVPIEDAPSAAAPPAEQQPEPTAPPERATRRRRTR
jgi:hypothetical protein